MSERGPEQRRGWTSPGWGVPSEPPTPSDGSPGPDTPVAAPPGWGGPPQDGGPQHGPRQYGAPQYGAGQYTAPPGWGGPPPGAPRPGVVPLRPLGLGELLDGSVGVVRRYPRPTLGLSFVVALVTTGLTVLLLSLLPNGLLAETSTSQDVSDAQLGGVVAGGLGTVVVTSLAGIVLAGVITVVVGRAVLGQPMSAAEAWRAVRPLLGRLVGLAVLVGLIVTVVVGAGVLLAVLSYAVAGGAGLLLGVPLALAGVVGAVWLYIRLSLAAPALVLEKVTVRESLRRSGVLVRQSWWRVLGILVLTAIIAGAVGQVLQLPFLAVGGGAGLFTGSSDIGIGDLVLAQIGAGIAQTLTAPFSSGVRALLYIDRRMRAEGLDVALAAAAADRRP